MSQAFSLHGQVSVETRRAREELREFQSQLEGAAQHMDALLKGKKSVTLKVNAKGIQSDLQDVAKEAERTAKKVSDTTAREAEKAAREQVKAAQNAQRERERLDRQEEARRKQARREQTREEEKASRDALRRQKEFGAAWAREIDATFRREGETLNRFGERVRTVTGLLKDIEKNTSAIKVNFKVDPRGDLKTVRRQIQAAQTAAGATKFDLKSDEARAQLNSVLDQLKNIKSSAKVTLELDQKGGLKSAGAEGDAASAAEALKKAVEDAAQARAEILEKVSQAATISGAGITAAMGLAANAAVDFDGALRNVNTIAQLSESNLQKLGDAILAISFDPKIRQDAQDLVAAMNAIYSSGYKGAKALDILKESAIGASAGQTDTATSSKVLMAVLSSGIPGVKTAHGAMDVLFKTVDQGVLTFGDLAGALGQILPTAATAKIPLQQIGAAIAVMTQKGQSGSEAVNDLLNLISKIANPSVGATKQFKELGISFGFSGLAAKGLPAILDQIQSKTKGNADEIKKLLPDMQAQRAALSLLAEKGKAYKAALEGQNTASQGVGASMRALSKANQGVSADVARSQKEFKNLSILAGQTVVPALTSMLRSVSGLFKWFNELPRATQENIVKWTAYAGVGLLLLGRLKAVIDTVALVKMAFVGSAAAAGASTTANAANAVSNARLGTSLSAVRARLIATSATSVSASARMATAFKSIGVPLLAIGAIVWGVRTAVLGFRDAGTMSADRLIARWGVLGRVWVSLGDKLGNLMNLMNRAHLQAGDTAEAQSLAITRARLAKAAKSKGSRAIDGSHADGLSRVPFDGYRAELHKDEAVLTASEAAVWRARKEYERLGLLSWPGRRDRAGSTSSTSSTSSDATSGPTGGPRAPLAIARGFLGTRGADPHVAKWMREAGSKQGEEWCGGFVSGMIREANKTGAQIPWLPPGRGAAVKDIRSWAQANGQAYTGTPKVGDVMTIRGSEPYTDRKGRTRTRTLSHTALVSKVDGERFWTIGGNEGAKDNYASRVQSGNSYRVGDPRIVFVSARSGDGRALDMGEKLRLSALDRLSARNARTNRRDLGDDMFGGAREVLGGVRGSLAAAQARGRAWALRGNEGLDTLARAESERTQAAQDERSRISFERHLADLERKLRLEKQTEEVIGRRLDLERYEQDLAERQGKGDLNAAQARALGDAFKSRQAAQAALESTTRQIEATARVGEAWDEMGEDVAAAIDAATRALAMTRRGFPRVGDLSGQEDLPDILSDRYKAHGDRADDLQQARDDASRDERDRRRQVADVLLDARERAAQALEHDPIAREMISLRAQLTRDGWSEEDIQRVLPTARWSRGVELMQSRIDDVLGNIESSFGSAFDRLYDEGPKGFFDEMVTGLRDTLKSMASQILASAARNWIAGLFGGMIGKAFTPGINPGATPPGWHAPMALPGHAAGLDRVPFDNYVARLHKNELVLNARDAQRYRDQDSRAALASARGAGLGGSSAGAGSSSTTIIHNSYQIGTVRANDPQEFTKQLPGRQMPAGAQRSSLRRALGST